MTINNKGDATRTIILAIIGIPIIVFLLYSANKKSKESGPKMKMCQAKCELAGYDGYEFKWGIVGGPECDCINN